MIPERGRGECTLPTDPCKTATCEQPISVWLLYRCRDPPLRVRVRFRPFGRRENDGDDDRRVRAWRLRHGILLTRSQSHPRRVPGHLTIPQLAARLGVSASWIYDRVHNGTIAITRDEHTGLYLFPDAPGTLDQLRRLRAGELDQIAFGTELGS